MDRRIARELIPLWANAEEPKIPVRMQLNEKKERFIKRYGIFLVLMCAWTISLIICSAVVHHRTEKTVWAEARAEYAVQLERYKAEQREAEQASYFLSGDASRDAAINQEIDAVAMVIAKLSTDSQKLTEASCMLARVMSSAYPNSFREVSQQKSQWMFFDPDAENTFSPHDRDLADQVVRPYMESGVIPNGLTDKMVYGSWSPNDFVLRDSYETTTTMHTWRWS